MSLFRIFDIAGSALSAQSTRLNTVASNIANAEVASSSAEGVYRLRQPVFAALLRGERGAAQDPLPGVQVLGIVESQRPPRVEHLPGHPLADENGYVYFPAISTVEEMANMISAARSYQNNVEVASTVKQLMLRTLQLGQR
ncbi:MAG TPA: flagellar basal body rod protein FlgC [Gammaproteobacteria bacterium]